MYHSESSNENTIMLHTNSEVEIGELENLIQILKYKISVNDSSLDGIKYPNLLITSLMELRNLVGMDRLKDSIALQVMRLIDANNNGENSNRMLNSILYGPPGVGKTKVGIIMAKIWYSLGYLKRPNSVTNHSDSVSGVNNTTEITTTNQGINPWLTIGLLLIFYGFATIASGASYVYNRYGMFTILMFLFIVIVILGLLYWHSTTYTYIKNYIESNSSEQFNDNNIRGLNDRDIITVVSRQDFVAEYVGQTAVKTKKLLYANMGKVLFIDEAYSLINGDRDPFGMEALTTLNLFMSEYPDSIAIIFAGYKDIMKQGIFRIQPGLPRRCMWHFECVGYDGEQLAEIFFRQVYKDGWNVQEGEFDKIRQLIVENEKLFPSYGGDTERLVFFSQLEASRYNMFSSNITNTNTITMADTDSIKICDSSDMSSHDKTDGQNRKTLTHYHVEMGLRRLMENDINNS